MAKSPENRFQSYDEFIMALTAARSQYLVNHFRNQAKADANGVRGGKSWWRR
jgi:hypothetical protein